MKIQRIIQQLQHILFFFIFFPFFLIAQTNTLDSLKKEWSNKAIDTLELGQLIAISDQFSESDFEQAIEIAQYGLDLSQEKEYASWQAAFNHQLGNFYQSKSSYDTAKLYLDQAIAIYQQQNNLSNAAQSLVLKGKVLTDEADFSAATQSLLQAIELYEQSDHQAGLGYAYTELADALFYLERYADGAAYGEKAIAIYQQIDRQENLALAYQAAATCYMGVPDYEQALEYMKSALAIIETLDTHPIKIASIHNSIGNAYKKLKRYEEALTFYFKSQKIVEELQHPGGRSATMANIGEIYLLMGDYEKARINNQRSIEISEQYGFQMNLLENLCYGVVINKALKNYEEALAFSEKARQLQDTILSAEKDKIAKELTLKYETAQKEELIATQAMQIRQQRMVQLLGLGLAVVFGILLLQFYRNAQQKQKVNTQLAAINAQLAQKNQDNELLLREIHHRVKNNLQVISSLLSLQSAQVKDEATLEAMRESRNRVRSMALIHQKLYQRENLAGVEMRDYFKTLSKGILTSFGIKSDQIAVKTEMEEIEMDVDYAIPIGLIVNELLTNSMKYAFPKEKKGEISISLSEMGDNQLKLVVADSGIGNSDEQSTSGTGFGSQLVQLLTMQINGKLEVLLEDGRKTILHFKPVLKQAA
ncbi:MAG: tetratricopeptide repeat protein [Bacteroidota bacterium]